MYESANFFPRAPLRKKDRRQCVQLRAAFFGRRPDGRKKRDILDRGMHRVDYNVRSRYICVHGARVHHYRADWQRLNRNRAVARVSCRRMSATRTTRLKRRARDD